MRHVPFCVALSTGLLSVSAVLARPPTKVMMKLEYETRVLMRCDDHVMGQLRRQRRGFHPETVVSYAFSDPIVEKTEVIAGGAAVRGHGRWYHVAYRCRTSSDGLEIEAFNYRLGALIPRTEWEQHHLVPR